MTSDILIAWAHQGLVVLTLLAVVLLPGVVTLKTLRVGTLMTLAAAPALSALLVGATAYVLGRAGADWGWPAYACMCAVSATLALIVRKLVLTDDRRPLLSRAARTGNRADRRIDAGAVAVFAVASIAPMLLFMDPTLPNPGVDPMYHYNALNAISHSGDASMVSAMDYNYGLRTLHVTYPSVWHALVVLAVPVGGIIPSANVMGYVVTPLLFGIGLAALGRQLFPRSKWMPALILMAAIGFPAFPVYMVVTKAFWPNSLALAMLPGVLALAAAVRGEFRWGRIRKQARYCVASLAILLASVAGMALAHPSLFFSFIWVLIPFALGIVLSLLRPFRVHLSARQQGLFWIAFIGICGLGIVLATLPRQVRGYLARPSTAEWSSFAPKLVSAAVNWPVGTNPIVLGVFSTLFIPVFALGLVTVVKSARIRWIAGAWFMQMLLVLGAFFPIVGISSLSGLWYSDSYRLFAVQNIFTSVIVAVAVLRLLEMRWRRSSTSSARARGAKAGGLALTGIAVGFLVLHGVWSLMLARNYALDAGSMTASTRPLESPAELAMLKGLDGKIPPGSVMIGDPASGTAYVPLYSNVQSVFTQVNPRDVDFDGNYLYENFDDINSDPAVCAILREYGVGYYYQDRSMHYNNVERSSFAPGFYDVDTSKGFTLIAKGGSASVWRIDACGRIQPPSNWWDRTWRKSSLFPPISFGAGAGRPAVPVMDGEDNG